MRVAILAADRSIGCSSAYHDPTAGGRLYREGRLTSRSRLLSRRVWLGLRTRRVRKTRHQPSVRLLQGRQGVVLHEYAVEDRVVSMCVIVDYRLCFGVFGRGE